MSRMASVLGLRMATRHAELGPPLRSLWPSLERNLCEAGFHMRSATCYPAISGGASWLANAQLFADGLRLRVR